MNEQMNQLPDPPVPADLHLRSFAHMPLDVVRLRDSGLAQTASAEAFRAAVLLYCVAWHQLPAGSLPDDDRMLAAYVGLGRDLDTWLQIKKEALRGFYACSDGRLYHPVVTEKVLEAAAISRRQRNRRTCKSGTTVNRGQSTVDQDRKDRKDRKEGPERPEGSERPEEPETRASARASEDIPSEYTAIEHDGRTLTTCTEAVATGLANDLALAIGIALPGSRAAKDPVCTALAWTGDMQVVVANADEARVRRAIQYFATSGGRFWVAGRDGPPAIREPLDLLKMHQDGHSRLVDFIDEQARRTVAAQKAVTTGPPFAPGRGRSEQRPERPRACELEAP